VRQGIRSPLTLSAVSLLFAAVAGTPLHGGDTAITLNFSGSSSSSNTSTGFSYVLNGAGPVTPFGTATIQGSGAVVATGSSDGTVTGSYLITFGSGDSFQGDLSGQFSFDTSGNPMAMVTATITAGTGIFNKATGSTNLMFAGVSSGKFSSKFKLTGSGTLTTPSMAPTNVSVDPSALQFATNQASNWTCFLDYRLEPHIPVMANVGGLI